MLPYQTRVQHRLRSLLAALVLAFCTLGLVAGPSVAGTTDFCSTEYGPYDWCGGPNHSLTSVVSDNVSGNESNCAGAKDNGVMYGSYFCATDYACHTYGGNLVHTPVIKNNVNSNEGLNGYSSWGSTGAYNGCPRGAPQRLGGIKRSDLESALPAFKSPSRVAAPTGILRTLGIAPDTDGTRSVETTNGPAWVTVESDRREICLLVTDGTAGYGVTCRSAGVALSEGFTTSLQGTRGSTVVSLTPTDSSQPNKSPSGLNVTEGLANATATRLVARNAG